MMPHTKLATCTLLLVAAAGISFAGTKRHAGAAPPDLAGKVTNSGPMPAGAGQTQSTLDFHIFKTKVEPIFLKERPGHARCYGCHTTPNRDFYLETLSPGSAEWSDEQSRRNYQNAVRLVVPGDPLSSRLLIHPLAPEAGGDPFHSGGRQFSSQTDPDWLVLADWVRGLRSGADPDPSSAEAVRIYVTSSAGD